MSWWPGWDSIESAGRWEGYTFWFGIFAFAGGLVAEVIEHRSGKSRHFWYGVAGFVAMLFGEIASHEYSSRREDLKDARHTPREVEDPAALAAKLVPFAGEGLSIVCDPDQLSFAHAILVAARAARWYETDLGSSDGKRLPAGATLYLLAGASARTADAARVLADGLRADGAPDLRGSVTDAPPEALRACQSKIALSIGRK